MGGAARLMRWAAGRVRGELRVEAASTPWRDRQSAPRRGRSELRVDAAVRRRVLAELRVEAAVRRCVRMWCGIESCVRAEMSEHDVGVARNYSFRMNRFCPSAIERLACLVDFYQFEAASCF